MRLLGRLLALACMAGAATMGCALLATSALRHHHRRCPAVYRADMARADAELRAMGGQPYNRCGR